MKHKEYIIPIGEEAKEFDEMFIGVIRKQPELIRCKDCKHSLQNQFTGDWYCWLYNIYREVESDGFCYKAERINSGQRYATDLIRCKDCKFRDPENKKCDCGHGIIWQLPRDDDWFCADAERKEE